MVICADTASHILLSSIYDIYINNDNNDNRCADIASHTFRTCPTYIKNDDEIVSN